MWRSTRHHTKPPTSQILTNTFQILTNTCPITPPASAGLPVRLSSHIFGQQSCDTARWWKRSVATQPEADLNEVTPWPREPTRNNTLSNCADLVSRVVLHSHASYYWSVNRHIVQPSRYLHTEEEKKHQLMEKVEDLRSSMSLRPG